MNPDGRIYQAPADEVPAEDAARLDGYLRGRAEAVVIDADMKAALEEQFREMKASHELRER